MAVLTGDNFSITFDKDHLAMAIFAGLVEIPEETSYGQSLHALIVCLLPKPEPKHFEDFGFRQTKKPKSAHKQFQAVGILADAYALDQALGKLNEPDGDGFVMAKPETERFGPAIRLGLEVLAREQFFHIFAVKRNEPDESSGYSLILISDDTEVGYLDPANGTFTMDLDFWKIGENPLHEIGMNSGDRKPNGHVSEFYDPDCTINMKPNAPSTTTASLLRKLGLAA